MLPALCPECRLSPGTPHPCHLPDHQVPAPPAGISVRDGRQQPAPHWTACPDSPRPSSLGHFYQPHSDQVAPAHQTLQRLPLALPIPGLVLGPAGAASPLRSPSPTAAPPLRRGPAGGSLPRGACAVHLLLPLPRAVFPPSSSCRLLIMLRSPDCEVTVP